MGIIDITDLPEYSCPVKVRQVRQNAAKSGANPQAVIYFRKDNCLALWLFSSL
jgi:hypothetical protein